MCLAVAPVCEHGGPTYTVNRLSGTIFDHFVGFNDQNNSEILVSRRILHLWFQSLWAEIEILNPGGPTGLP